MSRTDPALVERARQFQEAGRLAEAEALWRHLAATDPEDAGFPFNLGVVLAARGRLAEAITAFERAATLAPRAAEAFANLGVARQRLGQIDEAVDCYRQALSLKPDFVIVQNNLAGALQELGLADEALDLYRQIDTATNDPGLSANLLTSLNLVPGLLPGSLAAARHWAGRFVAEPVPLPPAVARAPGERLRVGYVGGPGLRRHTLALTWLPLIEAHDPARVEVFVYSDLPEDQEDDVSRRFQKTAQWRRSAGLDDRGLADLVRRDGIHILVDGIGFAAGSRLPAFGLRPAPIQVHFPPMSTTGMTAIDYLVADDVLIEESASRHFQERIWRLPCCFLYLPIETLPAPSPPPCLRKGAVTFGSFNRLAKVGPAVVAAWARILRAVPGSRLLIKTGSVVSPGMIERYTGLFASHGVPSEALEFRGRTASDLAHYAMLGDLDIALDPFPHGGVLTTCDAVALGIPVVTLAGARPLERYGTAILSAAGFADGIATSVDDYVARAVELARGDRLAGLRTTLSQRMRRSSLMDATRFARSLEEAYEGMWREQSATWNAG
jgi:protein O-GlcNAc transferase